MNGHGGSGRRRVDAVQCRVVLRGRLIVQIHVHHRFDAFGLVLVLRLWRRDTAGRRRRSGWRTMTAVLIGTAVRFGLDRQRNAASIRTDGS